MSYIRGAALYSDELASRIVLDIADDIAMLEKDKVPLLTIMTKIKSLSAKNIQYGHFENQLPESRTQINYASYTAGDEDLVVDDATMLRVNDIVKIPRTGECILVSGVTVSGNHLLCAGGRGFGETSAAAIVDNDEVEIIGNAYADNSGVENQVITLETYVYNYLQLFKHSVQFGYRNLSTDKYGEGGKERTRRQHDIGVFHAIQIEKAFWFGERKWDTTADTSTTRGIIKHLIAASCYSTPGYLTHYEFEEFLRQGMRYSSSGGPGGTKLLFCSELIISIISSWAFAKIQTETGDTEFGLGIQTYISPHGRVKLIKNFHFQGNTYGGFGALIDIKGIKKRFMRASEGVGHDWNTKLYVDKGLESVHGTLDFWVSDVGVEVFQAPWHRGLTGVTGG